MLASSGHYRYCTVNASHAQRHTVKRSTNAHGSHRVATNALNPCIRRAVPMAARHASGWRSKPQRCGTSMAAAVTLVHAGCSTGRNPRPADFGCRLMLSDLFLGLTTLA
jgi:hypothetical protein